MDPFGFDEDPQQTKIPPVAGACFRDPLNKLLVSRGDGSFAYEATDQVVEFEDNDWSHLHPVPDAVTLSDAVPPDHNDFWRLVAMAQYKIESKPAAAAYVVDMMRWAGVVIREDIATEDIPAWMTETFTWATYNKIHDAIETYVENAAELTTHEQAVLTLGAEKKGELITADDYLKATAPPVQAVDENGEVVPIYECLKVAGVEVEDGAPLFEICDDQSLDWFVGLIRGLQHEIEDIAVSAVKMIQIRVSAIQGLMFYYSPQLRAASYANIKRKKDGKLACKNVRTMRGGLYWKVLGGVKCYDKKQAIARIQEHVPEHEWEEWGLHWAKPRLELRVTQTYKQWLAGHHIDGLTEYAMQELGIPTIGSAEKAWSFTAIRDKFKQSIKAISLRNESEDNEDDE